MSKLAIAALVLSAFLALIGSKWTNDPASGPGFIALDFTPLLLGSQWIGFLLALAALLYYAARWRLTGEIPRPGIVASLLVLFFVLEGVPTTWDSAQWETRDVIRKWNRERKQPASRTAALPRFQGVWKSPRAAYEFQASSLTIRREARTETVSASDCEWGFKIVYRMGLAYGFPTGEETYAYLQGIDYAVNQPLAEVECGHSAYTFLIRPDGKMVGFFFNAERNERHAELLTR